MERQGGVRICLNMIVKNEEHVMRRCLDNVHANFDVLAICDTGSTDQTIPIIHQYLKETGKFGRVRSDPWIDFGTNRTYAIRFGERVVREYRREHPESKDDDWYFMFMDADNLCVADGSTLDNPTPYVLNRDSMHERLDGYRIAMRCGPVLYDYLWFIRFDPTGRKPWHWLEPLHEYMAPEGTWKAVVGTLTGGYVNSGREGARNKDPQKYLKDALLLEQYLKRHPDSAHALYYCGQSYRDAGVLAMAEQRFLDRVKLETTKDEFTYLSLFEVARCRFLQGKDDFDTIKYLLEARELRPDRFEAPFITIMMYRMKGYLQTALGLYREMRAKTPPTEGIFLSTDLATWRLDQIGALILWDLGKKQEACALFKKLVEDPDVPESEKVSMRENLATSSGSE